MALAYCDFCGKDFQKKKNRKQRYCSIKCVGAARNKSSRGSMKVENENGKIISESNFASRKEMLDLMDIHRSACCLIIKFD